MLQNTVNEYLATGIEKDNIIVYPIGRKVAEKVAKMGLKSAGSFIELADKPNSGECQRIAIEIEKLWLEEKIDKVEMIYHHFKSAGTQILTRKTYLPIDLETELNADHERDLTTNVVTKRRKNISRNMVKRSNQEKVKR